MMHTLMGLDLDQDGLALFSSLFTVIPQYIVVPSTYPLLAPLTRYPTKCILQPGYMPILSIPLPILTPSSSIIGHADICSFATGGWTHQSQRRQRLAAATHAALQVLKIHACAYIFSRFSTGTYSAHDSLALGMNLEILLLRPFVELEALVPVFLPLLQPRFGSCTKQLIMHGYGDEEGLYADATDATASLTLRCRYRVADGESFRASGVVAVFLGVAVPRLLQDVCRNHPTLLTRILAVTRVCSAYCIYL